MDAREFVEVGYESTTNFVGGIVEHYLVREPFEGGDATCLNAPGVMPVTLLKTLVK